MYLFKTVKNMSIVETIVDKSRFIGHVKPVQTAEEALEFIEEIKKKHKDASHNVPVYLIGKKMDIQKYSDDGEPSGTAGVPILSMLKNEEISNVVLVITRYFGGIKLGTGGLVRAYTNIAKKALEDAKIIEIKQFIKVEVELEYTLHGKIVNFISNNENILIDNTIYTDKVRMVLFIDFLNYKEIKNQIVDLTNSLADFGEEIKIEASLNNGKIRLIK